MNRTLLWCVLFFLATPLSAQTFDYGKLERVAAAFDYSTTGNAAHACLAEYPGNRYCKERDPLSRPFIGTYPREGWRLAIGWETECVAVSLIPNKKLRRIVQIGAIGAHVWFGVGNLRKWH